MSNVTGGVCGILKNLVDDFILCTEYSRVMPGQSTQYLPHDDRVLLSHCQRTRIESLYELMKVTTAKHEEKAFSIMRICSSEEKRGRRGRFVGPFRIGEIRLLVLPSKTSTSY